MARRVLLFGKNGQVGWELNRTLLEKMAPNAFVQVDEKFAKVIKDGFRYQDS